MGAFGKKKWGERDGRDVGEDTVFQPVERGKRENRSEGRS